MATKKELQKKHAKRRFQTRVGISLTQELHNLLVRKIQKGGTEAVKVEKQSNRVSVWDVNVKGCFPDNPELEELRVVYDSNTKNIVTTLYKDGPVI